MINISNRLNIKDPFEVLAEFLTEVWALLGADMKKTPKLACDTNINVANEFDVVQAIYDVDENLIVITEAFATADWKLYGRVLKQAVHELYHAFQVKVIGRELNYELFNYESGTINQEYYKDENEIEAHAFDEWFEQYWLKITTRDKHAPKIPDCDLLPKYQFEKQYKKFERRYSGKLVKNSHKWDLLTRELLISLKLI